MPSIRVLKTFLVAARVGSFAAAGNEVGLTPAAVGLQVRSLEEAIGRSLFDRVGRSIILNTQGREFLTVANDLVGRYEAAAHAAPDGLSGTVVMGALVSALMGAFAGALWKMKRDYPTLDIKLFAGLSADFVPRVERGELDAAVTTLPPRALSAALTWTPLYAEPMVLIVPTRPHFALSSDPFAILRSAPFLRFDRSTWTGDLVTRVLAAAKVTVNEGLEVNSVETIVALVRQGFGVAIVPKLDNVHWQRDSQLRIIDIPGNVINRKVGLLERSSHSRTEFTAAIKAQFSRLKPNLKKARTTQTAHGT
jgi:DNA-binding transcriptional LysR family regulator